MRTVSVIVVNYNGAAVLDACLAAATTQLLPAAWRLEVVVVDNASTDGSRPEADPARGLRVVALAENTGFAGGCNAGFAATEGPYVALLNPDARPRPGWLAAMLAAAEADPGAGLVACTLLQAGTDRIDNTGHRMGLDGLNVGRDRLAPYDPARVATLGPPLFPSGAACLIRRAVLDAVGGFDEAFFCYGEDADLGLAARLAGWRCAFAADAVVDHDHSAVTGLYSAFTAYHVERNRLWVAAKHFPAGLLVLNAPFAALRYGFQAYAALTGRGAAGAFATGGDRGRLALVALLVRAWRDGVAGLPAALAQRRRLAPTRRVTGLAAYRLFLDRRHRATAREVGLGG